MAKKIDIKSTLGNPTNSLSVDAIEEMTRKIHAPTIPQENRVEELKVLPEKKVQAKQEKTVIKKELPPVEKEPVKRGRKPSPPASDERMIRVSVDLPESVFIQLKVKVIQEKTDMKTFVWRLLEKELNK